MFTKRYLAATQLIYFLLDFLLMFLLPRFMIFLIKEDYKVIAVGQRQFYCLIRNFDDSVRTSKLSTWHIFGHYEFLWIVVPQKSNQFDQITLITPFPIFLNLFAVVFPTYTKCET